MKGLVFMKFCSQQEGDQEEFVEKSMLLQEWGTVRLPQKNRVIGVLER